MTEPFAHAVDVRVGEVDYAGVVFNAHYLGWCDDARLAFLADLGFDHEWFAARGELSLVRHAELDWLASLRILEHGRIDVRVERVGTTSFTLRHEVRRTGTDTVAFVAVITYAHVDLAAGTKQALPAEFAEALRARMH